MEIIIILFVISLFVAILSRRKEDNLLDIIGEAVDGCGCMIFVAAILVIYFLFIK